VLFHKDIGIPSDLARPKVDMPLRYSQHAKSEALKEGITTMPFFQLPVAHTVIETEVLQGQVTKWVVRLPLDDEWDVVLVVQPDGFVRTLWLNAHDDTHRTLKVWMYTRPSSLQPSV